MIQAWALVIRAKPVAGNMATDCQGNNYCQEFHIVATVNLNSVKMLKLIYKSVKIKCLWRLGLTLCKQPNPFGDKVHHYKCIPDSFVLHTV